ncbi:hypothetical protein ABK040_007554 [Willaertia magna]
MEYQYRRYLLKLRYANVNDVPRGIKTQYKDSVKFREYVVHGNIVRDVLKTGKLVLIVVVGIPKAKGQAGWKIEEDQILSMLGPHLEDETLRICPDYEPKERDKKDMHILDTPPEAQRTGNYNSGVTSGNQNPNTTDSSVAKNRALTQLSSASDFITVISEVGDSISKVLEQEKEEKKKEKHLNEQNELPRTRGVLLKDGTELDKNHPENWTDEQVKKILAEKVGGNCHTVLSWVTGDIIFGVKSYLKDYPVEARLKIYDNIVDFVLTGSRATISERFYFRMVVSWIAKNLVQ